MNRLKLIGVSLALTIALLSFADAHPGWGDVWDGADPGDHPSFSGSGLEFLIYLVVTFFGLILLLLVSGMIWSFVGLPLFVLIFFICRSLYTSPRAAIVTAIAVILFLAYGPKAPTAWAQFAAIVWKRIAS